MAWIAIRHEAIYLQQAEAFLAESYLAVTSFHESDIAGDLLAGKYELRRLEVPLPACLL